MDSEIGRPHTTSAGRTTATGLPSRSMMTSSPSDTRGITKAKSLAASDNVVTYSLRVLLARICPEEHSLWYGHDLAIRFPSQSGATHRARALERGELCRLCRPGHRSGHAKRQRKPIAGQRVSLLLVPCPRAPKRFVPGYCDLGNS